MTSPRCWPRSGVGPVDVLGFSNGGQVALQLAARHPSAVRRLIAASAPVRRSAMVDGFWDGLAAGTFDDLPGAVPRGRPRRQP